MANFLIQTIDGQVRHDFSFALMEAIDFQNWSHKGSHDYVLIDMKNMLEHDFTEYIPSGTIQFIQKFLQSFYDIHSISPINIPLQLFKEEYLKRNVVIKNKGFYEFENEKFVKSDIRLKGATEIMNSLNVREGERYLVSDLVDIESEWRTFIFNKKIVGLQNYLGDFTMMPDINLINEMVSKYDNSPTAYTIDVGINFTEGTFLIECHNIFSVGTYGFSNNQVLPQMIIAGFRHLLKCKF